MRALPYFMFIPALGAMLAYHLSMVPAVRSMAVTLNPLLLLIAAIVWGGE